MSSRKKVETELITGSYLYEQIRRGVMLGSEDAVVEFEALLQATLESMLRLCFRPDNEIIDYYARDRYITLNRVSAGWLLIVKNILTDFGHAAQANLSGKAMHTTEAVIGAATNVRRFDIIDDEAAENPYKKHTIQLHPRKMANIASGSYDWWDKAWEAWFNDDDEVSFGEGGDVQVSPIVEEQVTIALWAITHALETDYLYRRYDILQQKLERAIEGAKDQIEIYEDLVGQAVENMAQNKVRITKMAGNSLIELRQMIRTQKLVKQESKEIAKSMENGALADFISVIDRAEDVIGRMNRINEEFDKKSSTLRGQLVNFNTKYNKMEHLFEKAGIDMDNIDEEFGIREPSIGDRVINFIKKFFGMSDDTIVNEKKYGELKHDDLLKRLSNLEKELSRKTEQITDLKQVIQES